MAPIKFENDIKETLEKRAIQPSQASWDKLSSRLDAESVKHKHRNKRFWWMGIAASFVGILLVGSLFFKRDAINMDAPTIVDVEEEITPKEKVETKVAVTVPKVKESVSVNNEEEVNRDLIKSEISKSETVAKVTKSELPSEKNKLENSLPLNESAIEQHVAVEDHKEFSENLEPLDVKVQDVVTQITELAAQNTEVTDREIDSLLQLAELEIQQKKIYNESTRTVDANALLESVEMDLEHSFRDKVFKALKESYVTVKTAVTQRNQ
ncbi:hypothetical protein [Mangrovimonas sp. YM274]|uniref:hypothetical protein n=1 Tax=Mangrovimonas sp. YM274 TaxID=3070660 RepID=UPI0027DE1A83|nr:hypothetical protein [Mangrovimonas sp. YM274]WMI69593.1 hypothetical protein RBH95_04300 [Mangrovimonas sp. YM274]